MISDIMYFGSITIEEKVIRSCNSIIAAFFPGKIIKNVLGDQEVTNKKILIIEKINEKPTVFDIRLIEKTKVLLHQVIDSKTSGFLNHNVPLPGKEPLFQIFVKRALCIFLERYTGETIPWGILTGIRPGKLVFRMDELGLSEDTQLLILKDLYAVTEEKAKLLRTIANIQKPYLQEIKRNSNLVAIYISIPFCPSRCFYCSFPSSQLSVKNKNLLQTYLEALHNEIKLTGETMKEFGLIADCIYIGGGTPTVLDANELEMLFSMIHNNIVMDSKVEFTVEAGRPDTVDYSKLTVMKDYNINRISINPQSMQEQTLKIIGRNHTVSDLFESYYKAREISDWVINMDIILGLPNEGLVEISDTLEKVLMLKPENLTVHALALKKGSVAWESRYTSYLHRDWLSTQNNVEKKVKASGFNPYYLYRQKYMIGNLENVGYALKGKECRYNIAIIEEKQNIIGLGAGATSKILNMKSGHENVYNPIGIHHYITGYKSVHEKRKDIWRERYNQ